MSETRAQAGRRTTQESPYLDQNTPVRPFAFIPRTVLFIVFSAAFLYFGFMLSAWTYYIVFSNLPLADDLSSKVIYVGSIAATVGCGGAVRGLFQNCQRSAFPWAVAAVLSFATMLIIQQTR